MSIFQRETECKLGRGREREGDTEIEAGSRLRAVSTEPDVGLELTGLQDHDLSQSQTLNQLSHPGTPKNVKVLPFVLHINCDISLLNFSRCISYLKDECLI